MSEKLLKSLCLVENLNKELFFESILCDEGSPSRWGEKQNLKFKLASWWVGPKINFGLDVMMSKYFLIFRRFWRNSPSVGQEVLGFGPKINFDLDVMRGKLGMISSVENARKNGNENPMIYINAQNIVGTECTLYKEYLL